MAAIEWDGDPASGKIDLVRRDTRLKKVFRDNGGERGIRTLDRVSPIHAFQACAFNHSAISPGSAVYVGELARELQSNMRRLPNRVKPRDAWYERATLSR